jgi:hypothetical protein
MLGVLGLEDSNRDSRLLIKQKPMTAEKGCFLMIVGNADDNNLMHSGPNLVRYFPTCPMGVLQQYVAVKIAISITNIRGQSKCPRWSQMNVNNW